MKKKKRKYTRRAPATAPKGEQLPDAGQLLRDIERKARLLKKNYLHVCERLHAVSTQLGDLQDLQELDGTSE